MEENMSNFISASGENGGNMYPPHYFHPLDQPQPQPQPIKKKRNQPGHPDPDAEVIALSPRTLLATNRFVCEVCKKGFQRDQNLQLHRRGHNLPWKLKKRVNNEIKRKVYVCPETSCVHHDPSRALGDLTGIKKHFCRKHGEKKWKCEKCSKKYAVQPDWKAHSKTCGTMEYKCACGSLFSRKDSFNTHRAFCDSLAEEGAKSITRNNHHDQVHQSEFTIQFPIKKEQHNFTLRPWFTGPTSGPHAPIDLTATSSSLLFQDYQENPNPNITMGPTSLPRYHHPPPPSFSATALLQKAAQMGSKSSGSSQLYPSPRGLFIKPHQAHVSAGDSNGLNLSYSRDEFMNSLSSYDSKAAKVTGGSTVTGASTGGTSNPSLVLHDMMMMNNLLDQGSAFEDIAFGGILNRPSKIDDHESNFHATFGQFSSNSSSSRRSSSDEDNMMTRDFLGLRPLSQSDILSITGLSQTQKSWQG